MAAIAIRMFVFNRDLGNCADGQDIDIYKGEKQAKGRMTIEFSRVCKRSEDRCVQVIPFFDLLT